jgi:hypothetical protein
MARIDEGITNEEPEHDLSTEEGFRRYLEAQPGGADLVHSKSEWGAPNSAHRKAKVASEMAEGQRRAEAQITSRQDFERYFTEPSAGTVAGGITLPDDTPAPTPAAPSPEAAAQLQALQAELTTTKASLSEREAFDAQQIARDTLEEAVDETDVINALSILKDELSADDWAMFTMESLGDQLLEPEELERFNEVYTSGKAFEQAFDSSAAAQKEADELKQAQLDVLAGEQQRLGLSDEEYALHVTDMSEAARQLGMNFDSMAKETYTEEIKNLSALVAEGKRAYKSAAVQEQILYGSGGTNVEDGLTVMGQPVTPREPIEPVLDYGRIVTHLNRGVKYDIQAGVIDQEQKARSVGETIAALARKDDRDAEEKHARARRAGL